MPSVVQSSPVHYRLTPEGKAIRLEIWELPAGSSRIDLPYLFRLQYVLPSIGDAQATLAQHLLRNGYSPAKAELVVNKDILPVACISIADTHYDS